MGKVLEANRQYESLKRQLKAKVKSCGHDLTLASLIIEKSYSQSIYLASQRKLARELGIEFIAINDTVGCSEAAIIKKIEELNRDKRITGIIVNKPFPRHWREELVFSAIAPTKDIEGTSPYNVGLLCIGEPLFISPTVLSILELLKATGIDIYGRNVTIVGFSSLIGRPLSIILGKKFATVSITHIATYEARRLAFYTRCADVLISAVGKPRLIKAGWIKKGSVVIDVGTAEKSGKIIGDVEFEAALKKASWVSPVPGGVGKLTPLFLFSNLIKAAGLCRQ